MPATPDRQVLERFMWGDERAFEALYRHYEAEVFRWTVRVVRDGKAAEEVVVEAFWRAYRGLAWKYAVGPLNEEVGIA